MSASSQMIRENIIERMRSGELTAAEANVEMVRMERVRLVTVRMSRDVRAALSAAVASGRLGRVARDGDKPEAYYHPDFRYLALGERAAYTERAQRAKAAALLATMARPDHIAGVGNMAPSKEPPCTP